MDGRLMERGEDGELGGLDVGARALLRRGGVLRGARVEHDPAVDEHADDAEEADGDPDQLPSVGAGLTSSRRNSSCSPLPGM